jgi:hypothetical protein
MDKVIGTMVYCLKCQTVVWAHDSDRGDLRGIFNMLKIPCRLCGALLGFDGWNPTASMMKDMKMYDGWSTMHEIARRNSLEWDISPDNTWRSKPEEEDAENQTWTEFDAEKDMFVTKTAYQAFDDSMSELKRLMEKDGD